MDRSVFTDASLITYLTDNFDRLKVTAEKGEGIILAKKFDVQGYPTLIFLDASGVEKERVWGLATAKQLKKMGQRVPQYAGHRIRPECYNGPTAARLIRSRGHGSRAGVGTK